MTITVCVERSMKIWQIRRDRLEITYLSCAGGIDYLSVIVASTDLFDLGVSCRSPQWNDSFSSIVSFLMNCFR